MNIYSVQWVEYGLYGLSGVVVASDAGEALKVIDLDEQCTEVCVTVMGKALPEFASGIICKESL